MKVWEAIELLKGMPQTSDLMISFGRDDQAEFVLSVVEDDNCGGDTPRVILKNSKEE